MTKAKNPLGLAPFDAADYLTDDAAIAEFLNAALEDGNPDVFLQAVRTAARAACRSSPVTRGWDARAFTKLSHRVPNRVTTQS